MKIFLATILVTIALMGCKTTQVKDTRYLLSGSDNLPAYNYQEAKIKAFDLLGIQVFSESLNQEQALLFNLPGGSGGSTKGETSATTSSSGGSYRVTKEGNITVPVIGKVQVEGLTLASLTDTLTQRLSQHIKNPQVVPRFLDFKIQVLGEVSRPGAIAMSSERANILDAVALAGDLKDEGRRDSIVVIREENGQRSMHYVDLRTTDIFRSPVFQLQQNDVIYVQPSERKLKLLSADPEQQQKEQRTLQFVGFGLGVLSVVMNLILILTR